MFTCRNSNTLTVFTCTNSNVRFCEHSLLTVFSLLFKGSTIRRPLGGSVARVCRQNRCRHHQSLCLSVCLSVRVVVLAMLSIRATFLGGHTLAHRPHAWHCTACVGSQPETRRFWEQTGVSGICWWRGTAGTVRLCLCVYRTVFCSRRCLASSLLSPASRWDRKIQVEIWVEMPILVNLLADGCLSPEQNFYLEIKFILGTKKHVTWWRQCRGVWTLPGHHHMAKTIHASVKSAKHRVITWHHGNKTRDEGTLWMWRSSIDI